MIQCELLFVWWCSRYVNDLCWYAPGEYENDMPFDVRKAVVGRQLTLF